MRFDYFATAVLTAILLSACAEEPVFKTDLLASTNIYQIEAKPEPIPASQKNAAKLKQYALRLKGLSNSEMAEWIVLDEKRQKYNKEYQKTYAEWTKANPSLRGKQPIYKNTPDRIETFARLSELELKINKTKVPDKYISLDRNILSQHEIDELVNLEIAQLEFQFQKSKEYQRRLKTQSQEQALEYFRSATNNQRNSRIAELQAKIQNAKRIKNNIARIQRQSKAHNIALPQSDIEQIKALEVKKYAIQQETNKLRQQQRRNRIPRQNFDGFQVFSASNYNQDIKKNQIQINAIEAHIRAIRIPLDTAMQAKRTRLNLTNLSKKYQVVLLPSEIDELIDLSAEKSKLQSELRSKASSNSSTYGNSTYGNTAYGSSTRAQTYSDNQSYHARMREIDARMNAIKAPINAAQKAERVARFYARKSRY